MSIATNSTNNNNNNNINLVTSIPQHAFVTHGHPVLSSAECRHVIAMAEAAASRYGGWSTSRHYAVPTTDLPIHSSGEQLLR